MHEVQTYDNNPAHGYGFLYGILLGAAVGASVALLFAPKPGVELRGQIADATSRLRRKAGEAYDEASHMVGDIVEKGRGAARRGRQAAGEVTGSYAGTDSH